MKTYNKRLYRSTENKVIWGIMGGIGEYFDMDPVIFRAGYVLISVFTAFFPGIIAYILLSLIIPKRVGFEENRSESKPKEDIE